MPPDSRTPSTEAADAGLPIRLVPIPFPCREVGLPPECENLDIVPSRDLIRKFYSAMDKLQQPLEHYLQQQKPPPSCIISDKCLSWTSGTARKFGDTEACFPWDLPGAFVTLPDLDDIRNQMREAESTAYGVVVNTFNELEHGCVEEYEKAIKKKVWSIGPVSLSNKHNLDKFERGNKASIDEKQCLGWLDSMKPGSVVYACLGSQCRLVPAQLIELGLGLEASKQPFIWVIKTGERFSELEDWLVEERFEDRIKGRGLVIKVEGVCSGLGVEVPVRWGDEERVGVLVKKCEVEKAVETLMDGGEEGEMRKKRARELSTSARRAMEDGGSSHVNMSILIQDITKLQSTQENS
ncbi:UDP-glycosyltransferase 73D1 [Vitis vinifera]|uniref:UDP-glycosyltransferase 73D1 n=1 Tax=Vitis vinifera TaxID=29760 RepID=A0A438JSW0_VITVI|nr:UDP-glycosyltransferase 73D1 [Vitis vinifera]